MIILVHVHLIGGLELLWQVIVNIFILIEGRPSVSCVAQTELLAQILVTEHLGDNLCYYHRFWQSQAPEGSKTYILLCKCSF